MKRCGWPAADERAHRLQHSAVKSAPARPVGPRVRDRYWPGTLMGIGVFVALISALTVLPWTLMDTGLLLRFFVGLCFAGNLVPYAHSGLRLGMERLEWFLFNLLAIGPLVTSALLWVNFLFHGPVTVTDHLVKEVQVEGTVITYVFRDGFMADHWMARSAWRDWYPIVGNAVQVAVARGGLGVEVVVSKQPHVVGRP